MLPPFGGAAVLGALAGFSGRPREILPGIVASSVH